MNKENILLKISYLQKGFIQPDKSKLMILNGLNLDVESGTVVAITGASGSGKSTLLHLVGGMDSPDSGEVRFDGQRIDRFNVKKMAEYRNSKIGFVYQFHYLLPELSIVENVAFPFLMSRFNKKDAFQKGLVLLERVGIQDKADNMPYQLSGGERQRVAIARSLINDPKLLLADEPTGNLDFRTGKQIFLMFKELINHGKLTAIIVTHNEELADLADAKYHLSDGNLIKK